MERINALVSKKVISVEEGKLCGYVLDLVFDENMKQFLGLIVVDDETENTYFLNRKDMLSQGDDCVMIDGENVLSFDISSVRNNPIGKNVYDINGINLGRVIDVELSGKHVKKIISNKCEIPQNYILKSGVDFIIFGLNKKQRKKKINKIIFKNKEKIENLSEKMPKIKINSEINALNMQSENKGQLRMYFNPNTLLGKQLTNDLFGMNNEIIARKNEIINKKIIKNAQNHNKLNILAYFSK